MQDAALSTSPDNHAKIVHLLQNSYHNCQTGFGADHTDEDIDVMNLVYGEVTYAGMDPLFTALKLQSNDVFYELGCGTGKLVLYAALRRQLEAQAGRCVGLEVGERRLKTAKTVLDGLQSKLGNRCPEVSVFLQDISRCRFTDASVAVLCNLGMDAGIVNRTVNNLLKCQSFRRLVCTSPVLNPRLKLADSVKVSCTWAKLSSWHVYDALTVEQLAQKNYREPAPLVRVRSKAPLIRAGSIRCRRPIVVKDAEDTTCTAIVPDILSPSKQGKQPSRILGSKVTNNTFESTPILNLPSAESWTLSRGRGSSRSETS